MLSANQEQRASVDRVREEVTLYEAVGGEPYFTALVERFYGEVAADDLLRPMYPHDLSGAEERLRLFLMQYWGGPTTYSEERGHPRLRMRHNPYRVDLAPRCMAALHDHCARSGSAGRADALRDDRVLRALSRLHAQHRGGRRRRVSALSGLARSVVIWPHWGQGSMTSAPFCGKVDAGTGGNA